MNLTKEECEKAHHDIKMANKYPASKYNDSRLIDFHLVTFEQLINEHFSFIESYQHLLRNYTNLSKINSEIKEENNRLSQQLVECQRVAKQKQ